MKIAIVGAGIAGLTVGRILHSTHDVTIFESRDSVGGDASTIEVRENGQPMLLNTGVCMFFTRGYPTFFDLLRKLKIQTDRSDVTVEVHSAAEKCRYYFDLNSPLRSIAYSATHSRQSWFVRDGMKFLGFAERFLRSKLCHGETLGAHLQSSNYSESFRVMLSFICGSIWTIDQNAAMRLPLSFLIPNLKTIGFFPPWRGGEWRHVPGSVRLYLDALSAPLRHKLRLSCSVSKVVRIGRRVSVLSDCGEQECDHVIFACPPAQTLNFIVDPTDNEREVLSSFHRHDFEVAITSDSELIQTYTSGRPACFCQTDVTDPAAASDRQYLFNAGFAEITKICRIDIPKRIYSWYQFPDAPRPSKTFSTFKCTTPVFTSEILNAQLRHAEISGQDRFHFCGSAWSNGLHEGAVKSALKVSRWFGSGFDDIH